MAQRRMFSMDIVDTDTFLDMPASTQSLYFHLGMRADDDGFVSSPRRITAMVNCSGDDLKLLISKGFLIPFDTGVCVVRDWKINNYIRADRYKTTTYLAEKQLISTAENGAYFLMDTSGIPDDNQVDDTWLTQVRLGKDRVGKDRIESTGDTPAASTAPSMPKRISRSQYGWVKLSDEEYSRLLNDLGDAEVKRCIA